MPYGTRPVDDVELDFDAIFDSLIQPAAEQAGFDVIRSDREAASGVIMPRMFQAIYSADLVIADVTYQNPNVYYELGVRHALKAQGTLPIRRTGGDFAATRTAKRQRGAVADTAFDIKGVTVYGYRLDAAGLGAAVEGLRRQIERVAGAVAPDSPAFLFLDGLRVVTGSPRAHARDDRTYEVLDDARRPTGRFIGYRAGDVKDLRDERVVDYWVNSENVLMQMARIYERSVSSTIRFLGARQPDPAAADFDDTIATDLVRQLGRRHAVDAGEVVVTTSGRLRETHGVKAILHAAVVTGSPGRGFQPIADDLLIETTRNVLAAARRLARGTDPALAGRSLVMPLFGTGQARLNPIDITERLLREAVQELAYHADDTNGPDLTVVLFSAFTKDHVSLMQRLLDHWTERGELRLAVPHAAGCGGPAA
jgi:O-acetyl-ADP-ribose deacetylase (regulator of RNase III)